MSEKITKKKLTVDQRKARVAEMKEEFKNMKVDEAKAYIEGLHKNQIDKATMVAYVSVFGSEDDKKWMKKDFQKLASVEVSSRTKEVCDEPIIRKNRKGYTKEQTYKMVKNPDETKLVYNRIKAAEVFAERFGFMYKEPEKAYNEFDEI